MATESSNNETLDEITCPLCLEVYIAPKLLPCYHTFCKSCVDQLLEKSESESSFSCPLCRSVFKRTCSDFPTNIYIQTLISFLGDNVKCELCECETAVKTKCLDCDQYLCDKCSSFHLKIKTCKNHQVVEYNKAEEKSGAPSIVIKQNSYCPKHPDEVLRFYCKVCEIPVCRDCKHTTHEGHCSGDLQDRVSDATSWMQFYCRKLDFEISCYNNQRNNMINLKNVLDKGSVQTLRSLEELEHDVCRKVEKMFIDFKADTKKKLYEQIKPLLERTSGIESKISQLASKKRYIDQVVSSGLGSDIITLKSHLSQGTDLNEKIPIKHFKLEMPTFNIKNYLPSFETVIGHHNQLINFGMTLSFKNAFVCNVMNKSLSTVCILSTKEALVSYRYNTMNYSSQTKNVERYDSSGVLAAVYPIPAQEDIVVENLRLYYYDSRLKSIRFFHIGPNSDNNAQYAGTRCGFTRPVSMDICEKGHLIILDKNKEIYRVTKKQFSNKNPTEQTEEIEKEVENNICFDTSSLVSPVSIACGMNDDLWVSDPGAGFVIVYDGNGKIKFKFNASEHLKLPCKFTPNGISTFRSNKHKLLNYALVADPVNNCLFTISNDGQYCDVILDHRDNLEGPTCVCCRYNTLWISGKGNKVQIYEIHS